MNFQGKRNVACGITTHDFYRDKGEDRITQDLFSVGNSEFVLRTDQARHPRPSLRIGRALSQSSAVSCLKLQAQQAESNEWSAIHYGLQFMWLSAFFIFFFLFLPRSPSVILGRIKACGGEAWL